VRLSKKFSIRVFVAWLVILVLLISALSVSAANVVTNVTLSSTAGPPGTVVSITGSVFSAGNYTITFGSVTVIQSTAVPAGGSISDAFIVPTLPRTGAPYGVVITTTAGDTVNVPTFAITPAIWLDNSSGMVDDTIHVSGYGFLASTTITISFDSTAFTSVSSDASGTFSNAALIVPSSPAGWHTVSARDYIGSSPGVTFVVSPEITVSSGTGAIGSSITCSGKGFAANSNISFSLDSTVVSAVAVTNASGEFSNTTLTIPSIAGGAHTLQVKDASGNTATTSITVSALLLLSPDNGPAGTTITVTGSGFQANGTISISYNGVVVTTSPSPLIANSSGSFTATFTASALPAGVYSVVASDATRNVTVQFTNVATATIGPLTGAVGTSVTASGTGFRARASISVNYDDSQIATGTTDINGNFNITFTASSSSAGAHQIVITDKINTLTFSFNIVPAITIDPSSGFVGSDVTISGTGFTSKHTVSIKYDDTQLPPSSTDTNGAFTVVIQAPSSKGGSHVITVSDGTNTLTTTFIMDSAAPAIPQLLLPQSLTKADKLTTFSWQAVTDRSGVTYSLQIATDSTFTIIILQKDGLTAPTYTLTKEETLKSVSKKTPDYWRVKAIDGASNESAWSTAYTFYVGFVLADWAQWIIFGIVAILTGVAGYLLGMLRYRPKPRDKKETISE
jgi:hypothetical protein